MFGINRKLIDVRAHLKQLRHNLASSNRLEGGTPYNHKDNARLAKEMKDFIDHVAHPGKENIHFTKVAQLRLASEALTHFITACDKKEQPMVCQHALQAVEKHLLEYSSCGSIYLLRHADKFKAPKTDETKAAYERLYGTWNQSHPGKTPNLSSLGARQMKEVAEAIEEEILLSPRPVLIRFLVSDYPRTDIFARIIKRVNDAQRLGGKDVVVDGPRQHPALCMGQIGPNAEAIYQKLMQEFGEKEGVFRGFEGWMAQQTPEWQKVVADHEMFDPREVRQQVAEFVGRSRAETEGLAIDAPYTIIIGIGHSWNLDTWLVPITGAKEIINTAEYAKIEHGMFYYKGHWYTVR